MASRDNAGDIFDTLPTEHLAQLKEYVLKLYAFQLENAQEVFNQVMIDIEVDLGKDSLTIEKLTKKLLHDLKNYVSYEDAAWFVNRRLERIGQDHFGTWAEIFDCLAGHVEEFQDAQSRLLEIARKEKNGIKLLLANVLIAVSLTENKDRVEKGRDMLREINLLLERVAVDFPADRRSEQDNYYLCWAFYELAFLFRNLGDQKKRVFYFRKSLELNEEFGMDLGMSIYIETFLVRALCDHSELLDEMESRRAHLLENIRLALKNKEYFETVYRVKILREAFIDASKSSNARSNEEINEVGKSVYESLRDQFGDKHHEVVFTASQMALHFHSAKDRNECDYYFKLAEAGIKHVGEDSKIQMHTKSRAIGNLRRILSDRKRSQEAEKLCREEIRLLEKHLGKCNQYVAQAYRNLGFILRDLGRKREGLVYVKECLKISKECSPSFTSFHTKTENIIKRF